MKRFAVILFCCLVAQTALAQTINDPNAELRAASGFHALEVSHAFDVYLSQGGEEGVVVSAANVKDRENIVVEVKDGVLHVGLKKGMRWTRGDQQLKAYISFKQLDRLEASGACNIYTGKSWKAGALQVKLSGASDMKGNLSADALKVDLSGASDMECRGNVKQLSVEASGASNFKGYDLQAESCDAGASGASEVRITVSRELSVEASGASRVKYRGDAVIRELKNSGASSISKG